MEEQFMLLPIAMMTEQTIAAVRECNSYTERYGLQLSEAAIQQLMLSRKEVLRKTGRVEFGKGILPKLVMEFADSAYINQEDFTEILMELQECFYYFKTEALEEMTDDELIKVMKLYYEEVCQGSIEFLQSTFLENYCRDVRYDTKEYQLDGGYEDNYIDFLDWDGNLSR